MKKTIQLATSKTIINKEEVEMEFPEVPRYFTTHDGGNFFPRGEILFAIIPKYVGYGFTLVMVERDKQD